MVMETFIRTYQINKKLCDNLIKYHKSNKEYKAIGTSYHGIDKNIKESIDVFFYNQSNNKYIKQFFKSMEGPLNSYIKEFGINYKVLSNIKNVLQYYPPKGGYKIWHYENDCLGTIERKLVYMLYLNDVKNGGTEFYFQNVKLEAKKGTLVIWPADFTHTHKGVISEKEEKYIATGWFNMV
jgi:prolyl 4-hydroxylase